MMPGCRGGLKLVCRRALGRGPGAQRAVTVRCETCMAEGSSRGRSPDPVGCLWLLSDGMYRLDLPLMEHGNIELWLL